MYPILDLYPGLAKIVSFPVGIFLGFFLGSGVLWSFLQYRSQKLTHEFESAQIISGLRKELFDKLIELIQKSEQFAIIRDEIDDQEVSRSSRLQNKMNQLDAQIALLKDDILSGESRLAKLEKRKPRAINVKFVWPRRPGPFGAIRLCKIKEHEASNAIELTPVSYSPATLEPERNLDT